MNLVFKGNKKKGSKKKGRELNPAFNLGGGLHHKACCPTTGQMVYQVISAQRWC